MVHQGFVFVSESKQKPFNPSPGSLRACPQHWREELQPHCLPAAPLFCPLPCLASVPFPLLSGAAVPSSLALPWFGSEVQSPVEMYGFCAQPCVTHLLFFGVPWLAICSKMCVWTVVLLASLPLEAVGAQTSRS